MIPNVLPLNFFPKESIMCFHKNNMTVKIGWIIFQPQSGIIWDISSFKCRNDQRTQFMSNHNASITRRGNDYQIYKATIVHQLLPIILGQHLLMRAKQVSNTIMPHSATLLMQPTSKQSQITLIDILDRSHKVLHQQSPLGKPNL